MGLNTCLLLLLLLLLNINVSQYQDHKLYIIFFFSAQKNHFFKHIFIGFFLNTLKRRECRESSSAAEEFSSHCAAVHIFLLL